jgi:hypothetical protein
LIYGARKNVMMDTNLCGESRVRHLHFVPVLSKMVGRKHPAGYGIKLDSDEMVHSFIEGIAKLPPSRLVVPCQTG